MSMYEECCSNRPDHLGRFPCMRPWTGNWYRDRHYKQLLVMGESFYLPGDSTIHHEPRTWYGSRQGELTGQECAWIHTDGCITGEWNRAHRIYQSIQDEIAGILKENDVPLDERFPLNHVAYYNFFQRPSPREGDSMRDDLVQQDSEVAENVLRWFIECYKPELVVTASRFAGDHARGIVMECNLPFESAHHPSSQWWNRQAKSYGNRTGRELFRNFLIENHWVN